MEHLLEVIVIVCLLAAIAYAIIKFFALPIPAVIIQIVGWIIGAVLLIAILRVLWPLLGFG